jgi:hypothetical protein
MESGATDHLKIPLQWFLFGHGSKAIVGIRYAVAWCTQFFPAAIEMHLVAVPDVVSCMSDGGFSLPLVLSLSLSLRCERQKTTLTATDTNAVSLWLGCCSWWWVFHLSYQGGHISPTYFKNLFCT